MATHVQPGGDFPPGRSRLQRSAQNRTSSQQRSHFLRQENGRPHPAHGLDGRLALEIRPGAASLELRLPIPSPPPQSIGRPG
jgi:hypothetical protein